MTYRDTPADQLRRALFLLFVSAAMVIAMAMAQAHAAGAPRNIIIMISDGCGYNQIAATDFYQ
jgi:alkaline phosphatase